MASSATVFHIRRSTPLVDIITNNKPYKNTDKKDIPNCEVQDFAACVHLPPTKRNRPL